ncbi:hypothetical protein B0H12DRAFT_1225223 [Mycena haematopus]|nr:hypothetical protein B0H12DRAFT_1225223 [Mycena haematopus]
MSEFTTLLGLGRSGIQGLNMSHSRALTKRGADSLAAGDFSGADENREEARVNFPKKLTLHSEPWAKDLGGRGICWLLDPFSKSQYYLAVQTAQALVTDEEERRRRRPMIFSIVRATRDSGGSSKNKTRIEMVAVDNVWRLFGSVSSSSFPAIAIFIHKLSSLRTWPAADAHAAAVIIHLLERATSRSLTAAESSMRNGDVDDEEEDDGELISPPTSFEAVYEVGLEDED